MSSRLVTAASPGRPGKRSLPRLVSRSPRPNTSQVPPPPVAVHFYEEGFPPAFELQGFDVHLYNRGEEVATNVSPKRVELTRDEAFEYIKMEYISAHKGDTLAAVPVMGKLPADL